MKNTPDEVLKFAIQNSRNTFFENGYKDEESLESWLGQSLYYLYQNDTATGFSRESEASLKTVGKQDILHFLVHNYLGKINDTADIDIRDDFQNILKRKSNVDGLENAEEALSDYIESGDTSKFPEENREEILKYQQDSLLHSMGIITVKRVLQEESVKIESIPELTKSEKFSASDFAVLSNGEYDINKIVGLMEGIRSGKISPTKEENTSKSDEIERE